jgi:2-amino-4-hydroxy-6-hydroxymethyldihydropteridine diphosphokinase
MKTWQPAYVGIGSNLEDPPQQVRNALVRLEDLPLTRVLARSSLYGSRPLGPVAQPDFVNAVAGVLTQLDLRQFFQELRRLERALGRALPREHWGPRRIDLDLLVFGSILHASDDLVVPHAGIAERNFVLVPLAEIAEDLEVPGFGVVRDLLSRVSQEGLWRMNA